MTGTKVSETGSHRSLSPAVIKATLAGEGLSIDDVQAGRISKFIDSIGSYEKVRLVGNREPQTILNDQVIDSASCLSTGLIDPDDSLIDIGAGAGFPGIILKILEPGIKLTLLESNKKKADFLREEVQALGLPEVVVIQERAERAGQSRMREGFDLAVAKAVGPPAVVLEYALPLIKVGGHFIAQTGDVGALLEELEGVAGMLGAELTGSLPGPVRQRRQRGEIPERRLLVYRKTRPTPARYPRNTGIPQKRPLSVN